MQIEDTLHVRSAQGFRNGHGISRSLRKYQKFLVSSTRGHARSLRYSNGAASTSARQIFADLGAHLTVIGGLDGLNINDRVGSTHPEHCKKVKEVGAAIGLAFDGDSDQLDCC